MMGRSGSRMGSGGCLASHASSGAWILPNWVGRTGPGMGLVNARSGPGLPREVPAAVKHGQHLVRLRRGEVEDEARHAGIAIALDEGEVLRHAEDGDGDGGGVPSGCGGQLAKLRQEI